MKIQRNVKNGLQNDLMNNLNDFQQFAEFMSSLVGERGMEQVSLQMKRSKLKRQLFVNLVSVIQNVGKAMMTIWIG